MTADDPRSAARIRDLNDAFRRTFVGGTVVITDGVEALPSNQRRSILAKVRAFDAFTEDQRSPTASTTSARSTKVASAAFGNSIVSIARPSLARRIPPTPPSRRAS
jgi:hypothetical protein